MKTKADPAKVKEITELIDEKAKELGKICQEYHEAYHEEDEEPIIISALVITEIKVRTHGNEGKLHGSGFVFASDDHHLTLLRNMYETVRSIQNL